MNVWSEILDILISNKNLRELLIAPKAPPVCRTREGCTIASSRIFSAEDIGETLANLVMHSAGKKHEALGPAGVLSMGIREVGRLRICHFTQRGSRVLRIVRVPFEVPIIDAVCADPAEVRKLAQAVGQHLCKAMLIYGPSQTANSQVAYALLNEINQTLRQVIYVVERALSFLLAHNNSLVVQVEVMTDVVSLEEALLNSFLLEPNIVHLGDLRATDEFPSMRQLFHSDASTVLSTLGDDPAPLLDRLPPPPARSRQRPEPAFLVEALPEANGRIRIKTMPWIRAE